MRLILAGYGEVGKGIESLFKGKHEVIIEDPGAGYAAPDCSETEYDALLVAFPYSRTFVNHVSAYIDRFDPALIVIFSTVPIGTTVEIKRRYSEHEIAHFPVEGKHPDIGQDIYLYDNIIGPAAGMKIRNIMALLESVGIEFTELDNSDQTEFLKLRSLAYYALGIEFARASARWAKTVGLDPAVCKQYDLAYNEFNVGRGRPQFVRYALDPPTGPIGGHCVLAGVGHLMRTFPDDMILRLIDDENLIQQAREKVSKRGG